MDLIQLLVDTTTPVTCGGISIPGKIASIVSYIVTILKFGVPLLLIIFGMLDLGKSVIASKEDEIKKGQKVFISRLIAAIIVFFIVAVVELVVGILADNKNEKDSYVNCIRNVINYNSAHSGNSGSSDEIDG